MSHADQPRPEADPARSSRKEGSSSAPDAAGPSVTGSRELDSLRREPAGRSGYDVAQVDDFLRRAADVLSGEQPVPGEDRLTSAAVRDQVFDPEPGGYVPETVDALLDRVEDNLAAAERAELTRAEGRTGVHERAEHIADLVMGRMRRPAGERFRHPEGKHTLGYLARDVDRLCEELVEYFRISEHPHPGLLRSAAFREATRTKAYDEAQVDAFMDRVHELIQLIR